MKFKNRKTGVIYRWLASGVYHKKGDFQEVAIYCPDDNEHNIAVCDIDDFYKLFEIEQ